MYKTLIIMIMMVIIVGIISFSLTRKLLNRIVSDSSPLSFADDFMIINTRTIFSIQISKIDSIVLRFNPKSLHKSSYNMQINILKTDGRSKKIEYRGRGSDTTPEDIIASLKEHNIKYIVKS